jgi:spore coat polysaccharide biosynthesis predicted glycosyltransferase SpsG
VYGGGSDPFNLALEIALAIAGKYEFLECFFFSADKINIESLDKRFRVLPFGSALDDVLSLADVSLTTASTSCFEILARGLPLGVACAVSNQEIYYSYLQDNALACPIGERSDAGVWNLNLKMIESLLTDSKYRDSLVRKSRGLVDSHGSKRIIDAIEALS